MVLTIDAVKTLIISVLERITGLDPGRVIIETETGPRPADGLYCSLWWRKFEPLVQNEGWYTPGSPDAAPEQGAEPGADPDKQAPLIQHLRHETYSKVRLTFRGPGAFEAATHAVGALQNDNRTFDLWRALGYGGVSAVHDVSREYSGVIQPRAFFDLSFYACFGAEYPVEWFDVSRWGLRSAGRLEVFEQADVHPMRG